MTTSIPYKLIDSDLFNYQRSYLQYVGATQVQISQNTDTNNKSKVIFPDGDVRSVEEDGDVTTQYRRFDITATASLTATHDSGMRSGESEANNTWYAIYAVKTTDDVTKFVLVGTVTQPVNPTSISTLNGYFGTNGWVYLGMIRNGDGSSVAGDILNFYQSRNKFIFANTMDYAALGTNVGTGMRLTAVGSGVASSRTWSYDSAQVPTHFYIGEFLFVRSASNEPTRVYDASGTRYYWTLDVIDGTEVVQTLQAPLRQGLQVSVNTSTPGFDINLFSWEDSLLAK